MSTEGQPNTILTEYSPFAWIEDTTNNYITFPTAQDRAITFPNVVNIGNSVTRTANISIGSNSSDVVGESTGSVNIMCGTGRQEGEFNVMTNTANTGNIVLGNTTAGNITINAKLTKGIPIELE